MVAEQASAIRWLSTTRTSARPTCAFSTRDAQPSMAMLLSTWSIITSMDGRPLADMAAESKDDSDRWDWIDMLESARGIAVEKTELLSLCERLERVWDLRDFEAMSVRMDKGGRLGAIEVWAPIGVGREVEVVLVVDKLPGFCCCSLSKTSCSKVAVSVLETLVSQLVVDASQLFAQVPPELLFCVGRQGVSVIVGPDVGWDGELVGGTG